MSTSVVSLNGRLDGAEITLPLNEGRHVVGRASDCDLVLTTPSVSRKHAALLCSGGNVLVEDLGSHNGTLVNSVAIHTPTPLKPGDTVTFADVTLCYGDPAPTTTQVTIDPHLDSAGLAVSWDEMRPERPKGQRKRSQLFEVLAEAGDLLTVPRAPEELFEPILDMVEDAIAPERTILLLRDEEGGEPVIKASRLSDGGDSANLTLSRSMVSRVLEEKTSFLLDEGGDSDLMQQQSIISQGIRSAMATPLFDNKRVIGILYADTTDLSKRYTRDELVAFSLLANVIAVALTHASYDAMEAEKRRLDTELDAARSILDTIIPDELPDVPGYEVCAHLEPCYEVGGDLYDVSVLPDGRVAVIVGDVSGKGLGAALLVSSLVPLLRAMLEAETDLCALMPNLNRQLWRTTDPMRFATLFVGILDPASGRLDYVNAGHEPPLVLRADGTLGAGKPTGVPVALLDEGVWDTASLDLGPGDLMALFTDGITETWRDEETEYSEVRLRELIPTLIGRSVDEVREAALADVNEFRGDAPVSDDVTLLLLKRDG